MKSFNVIHFNINRKTFESYDVIPYFVTTYQDRVKCHERHPEDDYWKIPETFEEFKEFVEKESLYQFWGRCEYEIILVDWPCQTKEKKIDVHWQIMMNLDIVTTLLIENIKESQSS